MNRSTKRIIFYYYYYLFIYLLHVFLPSWYLQKIFDKFGWFSFYIVAILLIGFSAINFLHLLLLSFFLFFFSFSYSISFSNALEKSKKVVFSWIQNFKLTHNNPEETTKLNDICTQKQQQQTHTHTHRKNERVEISNSTIIKWTKLYTFRKKLPIHTYSYHSEPERSTNKLYGISNIKD